MTTQKATQNILDNTTDN